MTFHTTRRAAHLTIPLALASMVACTSDTPTSPLRPAAEPSAARYNYGLPSAPLYVKATAGDAQATVSWQPPTSSGASTLVSYTVTAAPGGATATVAAPATTAAVTGLTNGTAYTFTVRARNSNGTGAASQPSASVTPSAPLPRTSGPSATGSPWVMGYYVGYQRSLYPETSVDFTYMTHIAVGAIQATPTGGVTTDFYIDNTNGPAMARTLASRAHAAGRKAILMLGGAGYHDNLASATSSTYRATFVANLLRTLDNLGYDGIDVDWEPVSTADQPQLLQFLRDLRAARPGILLTFPVNWVGSSTTVDSWYGQVASVVDRMNVMSYEMAGNWPGWVSWHSAALYGQGADHPSSVSSNAVAYRAAGVPAAKLGIGVGAYGSCWRGVTAPLQTVGSGAGVVASDNAMSYANIVGQYYTSAAYRWDTTARMGYLSFAAPTGPQQCTFVSYENPQSVAEKAAYVAGQGLGGTIVWTIGQGHLPNATAGAQDPLLKAAYTGAAQ